MGNRLPSRLYKTFLPPCIYNPWRYAPVQTDSNLTSVDHAFLPASSLVEARRYTVGGRYYTGKVWKWLNMTWKLLRMATETLPCCIFYRTWRKESTPCLDVTETIWPSRRRRRVIRIIFSQVSDILLVVMTLIKFHKNYYHIPYTIHCSSESQLNNAPLEHHHNDTPILSFRKKSSKPLHQRRAEKAHLFILTFPLPFSLNCFTGKAKWQGFQVSWTRFWMCIQTTNHRSKQ